MHGVAEPIDRISFCEQMEINPSTLSEWIRDKVIDPGTAYPGRRYVFTEKDVARARRFKALEQKHHGSYSRPELVEILDGKREEEGLHSPPGSPPPGALPSPDH